MNLDMFQLDVKPILGTPEELSWSQIHSFVPGDAEKLEKRGQLVLLVNIAGGENGQSLADLGKETISRVNEEYYGGEEGPPMECLRRALSKVGGEKSAFIERPDQLSLLVLVLWKNIIYLGVWNKGKILLRRNGKNGSVIKDGGDEVVSVSGFCKKNDLYFLATNDFFEKVPLGMITASLSTDDPETIAEVLNPVVHARQKQGGIAAMVVKVDEDYSSFKTESVTVEPSFAKIDAKVKNVLSKLRMAVKLPRLKLSLPRKTTSLIVAAGFLSLLLVSVFFGWKKRAYEKKMARGRDLATEIEQKIAAATAIKNLDPENTLKLLNETEVLIEEISGVEKTKTEFYRSQINALSAGLGGQAITPQMLFDYLLVTDQLSTEDFYSDGKTAYLLDVVNKRLLGLNLETKKGEIVAGGEGIADKKTIIFSKNEVYLLGREKFFKIEKGAEEKKKLEEVGVIDEEARIVAVGEWLGNLYFFDAAGKQIWKYLATEEGFGGKKAWLSQDLNFGFDQVVDMGIDGSIWLLLQNGKIVKLTSGRLDKFEQQLPTGIGKAKLLAVSLASDKIAFWDEEKKIVWVFDKEGKFVSRLLVNLEKAEGLAISPEGRVIYLLSGGKIYLVELKTG